MNRKRVLIGLVLIGLGGCEVHKAALNAVRNSLRDPESARFSDVKEDGAGLVCGYVNGKNGFGGYTGNTRFTVKNDGSGIWIDGVDSMSIDPKNDNPHLTATLNQGNALLASTNSFFWDSCEKGS